ncbi:hypothetical protein ERJ75_000588700 [Trypanosoma vivax]|nr:hypothetical protein ERJ75_000588700 [Trypanosoma vivax]
MQLRAVASPQCGPEREKLRAFCVALVQAKMCYGVASRWFDGSLSDRERLERVRAQAARAAAGIPKAANREDALREARLKPIKRQWPEGVGILPSPKGQGPDAREGRGQHLPT